jgi:hypothetical protein
MYSLRCTQALLDRLKQSPSRDAPPAATTVLGDWYANRLNVGRLRLVLLTSERSLLCVLTPARDLTQLHNRLLAALAESLHALNIAPRHIEHELREMQSFQYARTASRQVLGSMNDFAFLADTYLRDEGREPDLLRAAQFLNRTPCSPIAYQSPDRLVPELFSALTLTPQ